MKCSIVNLNNSHYDVFIGRPSKWENPFIIGVDGTRKEVIKKYELWLVSQPDMLDSLVELKGKILGCYCYPEACHGDVLVAIVNNLYVDPFDQLN